MPPANPAARLLVFLAWACCSFGVSAWAASPAWVEAAHEPAEPRPGQVVHITARPAPGVKDLVLEYQVVDPGKYIERSSPAFEREWKVREWQAAGTESDGAVRRAEMPAEMQTHRRLVRYRFRGKDPEGKPFIAPEPAASVPNHAYFVYGGVPAWKAAIHPKSPDSAMRRPVTFGEDAMRRVQSYHVIATDAAVRKVMWTEPRGDNEYRYTCSLVVDGVVHDHVRFRARGGVWRYAMGKNMWKFDLPEGQPLRARDDYGRPYRVAWEKVNLRACIQQGDYGRRGEQGMYEAVGMRLFNLASVAAPFTHWIQLRVITGAEEAPTDQYKGDYWGLYLAFEDIDGRFLKQHRLPPGNVFEMEGGGGKLRNPKPDVVNDGSDLAAFQGAYESRRQPVEWWRRNLDLGSYYSYRSICECLHHYDIADGKNYFYHRETRSGRWRVIPWDIDLTWGDHMYGGGQDPISYTALRDPVLALEYQNRLRELRDLLYHPAEMDRLIDECAAIIADPGGAPSPVQADRAKWDFHPVMAMGGKAGQGLFYQATPTQDFAGMVGQMKEYVRRRSAWVDRRLLGDRPLPPTPAVTYSGPAGHPASRLAFRLGEGSAPADFAALEWRLAEVAPAPLKNGRPTEPGKYEITAVWASGEIDRFSPEIRVESPSVEPRRTYRVRARFKDRSGTWGHWSPPVEFVTGER